MKPKIRGWNFEEDRIGEWNIASSAIIQGGQMYPGTIEIDNKKHVAWLTPYPEKDEIEISIGDWFTTWEEEN